MKATDFEVRNQTILHLLVVGLAFFIYAFQRDDIVWALIKGHSDRVFLERIVFGAGTFLIFGAAGLQTLARTFPSSRVRYGFYLGRIAFALGLGLLSPPLGTAILLAGECVLVLRLLNRDRDLTALIDVGHSSAFVDALRKESSKWGLTLTMVVFTLTLKDRLAEILAGCSLLLWVFLNAPDFLRSRRSGRHV